MHMTEKILFTSFLNVCDHFRPCECMHKHAFAGRNTQQVEYQKYIISSTRASNALGGTKIQNDGLNRDLNLGPPAPKAVIIPLDHGATYKIRQSYQVNKDIDIICTTTPFNALVGTKHARF